MEHPNDDAITTELEDESFQRFMSECDRRVAALDEAKRQFDAAAHSIALSVTLGRKVSLAKIEEYRRRDQEWHAAVMSLEAIRYEREARLGL